MLEEGSTVMFARIANKRIRMSILATAPSTAIVIPAFNEGLTIADIVTRARAVAGTVLVVDDGSTDGTAEIAEDHGALVLRNPVNAGKGASLCRGIASAAAGGARYVVTLDGDGQHRPEDLPRLLACAEQFPGWIVIGSRRAHKSAFPPARYLANRIADFWISWAAGHPIEDTQSGLRLYPAALFDRLSLRMLRSSGFALESEILIAAARHGCRAVAIDIAALYDGVLRRPSYFRPFADITKIVTMVARKLICRGMNPLGLWRYVRAGGRGVHWP